VLCPENNLNSSADSREHSCDKLKSVFLSAPYLVWPQDVIAPEQAVRRSARIALIGRPLSFTLLIHQVKRNDR
jgi:hypothetical protein